MSEAQEGITTIPLPFDDDDLLHVSDTDEEDQYQHDLGIEVESHEILDPDRTTIPNQRPNPRWAQNLITTTRDGARNPKDRRRTRSQYQNEHVSLSLSLSLTYSLPTKWFNKVLGKCYMMIANDQLLGPQKKKLDHSLTLPSRRNTQINQFRKTLRGSHA